MGPIESKIRKKLQDSFEPKWLEVTNESFMHNVPKDSETHFRVVLVAHSFQGQRRIDRQRHVNSVLKEELEGPVHALSMKVWTPEEWESRGQDAGPGSPDCRGGGRS